MQQFKLDGDPQLGGKLRCTKLNFWVFSLLASLSLVFSGMPGVLVFPSQFLSFAAAHGLARCSPEPSAWPRGRMVGSQYRPSLPSALSVNLSWSWRPVVGASEDFQCFHMKHPLTQVISYILLAGAWECNIACAIRAWRLIARARQEADDSLAWRSDFGAAAGSPPCPCLNGARGADGTVHGWPALGCRVMN